MHARNALQSHTARTLFGMAAITLACAGAHHAPEPYQSDEDAHAALQTRAAAYCAEANPEAPPPETPFHTDGCSLFFDTEWNLQCCIEHDIRYWCGGSAEQRAEADDAFEACVSANTSEVVGKTLESGVRLGGHPVWPTRYRWGYGREYSPTYPE